MFCLAKHIHKLIVVIILLNAFNISGQVFDDFSDENFTVDPEWFGDTSQFKITNSSAIPPELKPALQLDSEGSDTTTLYLPNSMITNTEWRFWIKLSFNTSANNLARIYLVSDQFDLESELNGYFVQIGGTNDSIGLFKQEGSSIEKIIPSTIAYTGNSTNILRIKVTKDENDIWSLYSDVDGGFNFELEGTAIDNTFTSTNYFGIYCKHTSSNATKFYFDDFYVDEIIIDTIPPEIISLEVSSETILDVYFNEVVEINTSQNAINYLVDNSIGNPESANRDAENHSLVHLDFAEEFQQGVNYLLSVSGVTDIAGNEMEPEQLNFSLEQIPGINPYDIVINEIMADVNPIPNSLPEADFLELYNRTGEVLNLKDCTIKPKDSSDPIVFPSVSIEPDSFLIIVQIADVEEFEEYGAVVGLPGFSLNNEGTVVLRNAAGNLLHAISYTEEWYQDSDKENGGWSIEQIDPMHPCSGQQNWRATENENGGTPGSRNSVDGLNNTMPEIVSAWAINENSISIEFSHWMDSLSIINLIAYEVNQGFGNPINADLDEIFFNSVLLEFSDTFQENTNYQLIILDSLFNCSEDIIELNSTYTFVLPLDAQPYEIVINEIMADPDPPVGLPEFEYVELFNTTSSFLRMNNWIFQVGTTVKQIPDLIIDPNEYIILTEDYAVNLFGMLARSFGFTTMGLTNSGTTLKLINQNGEIVSSVAYSNSWYNDSDKSEGGWSLEQIDPANPCPGKDNWTACYEEIGGTPGSVNSVDAENYVDPVVTKVIAGSSGIIEVYFNQLMDEETLIESSCYSVDNGIGNPDEVAIDVLESNKIILHYTNELERRILYQLTVSSDVKSCIGAPVPDGFYIAFGVAEPPFKGDIIINEVLFNPIDDGVDFVEIYNNSEKIIDISDLYLGAVDENQFEPNDTIYKTVSEENKLSLSNQILVLTKDQNKVKNQYFTENPDGFIDMESFPTYKNEEGVVILSSKSGEILDAFNYNEDIHHPILNSVDGVSLERINYDRPTQDNTNWHSASSEVGYATPAYKNSQFSESAEVDDPVTVDPEIFSPDNDGYNDVLNIHYKFESPGYTANIAIYDSKGRLVKYLVKNSLLETEGIFSWDGRTDNNQKASIGIYIIYFEAFDVNGNVKKYKKTAVLAGKL